MEEMITVKGVFHLSCPDRTKIVERLKKRALKDNRIDDANDEVISRRLAVYEEESKPVIAHYGRELITEIDAMASPVEVLNKVVQTILTKNSNGQTAI